MSKAGIINRIVSTALSIVLSFGAGAISVAEESEVNISSTHIALSVSQDLTNSDGDRVNIYAEVFNDAGESINASDKLTIYYKKGSEGKENKYNNKYLNLSKNNTYYFYAVYEGDETYAAQVSDTSVYSVKKFADLKGSLVSSATVTGQATGSITVGDVYPDLGYVSALTYYKADNPGTRITVDRSTITGLSAGTYYVSVPAKIDGDQIFISSGNRSVEIAEGAQPVIYQIRTTEDENISWTKTYFESKEGSTGSFTTYVSPKNSEEYYIKDVVAEPSGNANVLYYASTGEVSISDITGNVSLKAVYEKKEKPAQVDIEYIRPNENSNYSENNPSIQFTIGVSVKDDAGNPIPDSTVYFKADKNETDSSRKTDPNGVAQFKYSYGIVSGNDSADYEGSVSLNKDFNNAKSFPIHLIKQKKIRSCII